MFVVFGETAVSAEPGEGALDHPTLWQHVEAVGGGVPGNGDEKAVAEVLELLHKILAQVTALSGLIKVMDGRIAAMSANLNRLEEVLVITKKEDRAPSVADSGRVRAVDILTQRLPSVPWR